MPVSSALRRAVASDRARIAAATARLQAERAGLQVRLDVEIRALKERTNRSAYRELNAGPAMAA